MRDALLRTLLLLAGVALLGAACGDGGSSPTATPGESDARVGFSLNVAGTSVSTIAVEVTAPDITSRLVFNIGVTDGVATGSITIPAGADRTITARAFDAGGNLTHQGAKVVTVKGGTNTAITITLVPTAGEQPLTINFGALVVRVIRVTPIPSFPDPTTDEVGDTLRYRAEIRGADGSPVSGTVRWASQNPGIATVDATGLVTARGPGQVEIAATYQGASGSASYTVRSDGTDGTVDMTAPRVAALAFADSFRITPADTILTVTVELTDAGSGVDYAFLNLDGPRSGGGSQSRACGAGSVSTPPEPAGPNNKVSWTCRVHFSRFSAAGTWTIQDMHLRDRAGNFRSVTVDNLAASGIETSLVVANANADMVSPVFASMSIAADSINLTTARDTTVAVTVTGSDVGSGMSTFQLHFAHAAEVNGQQCYMGSYLLPPGTVTNQVTWTCYVHLPRSLPAGTYTVTSAALMDYAGNMTSVSGAELRARGWKISIKV
ncbi:MAG TPA: Ig-like domain-containing protein, partial [Longimicrobium sp.]